MSKLIDVLKALSEETRLSTIAVMFTLKGQIIIMLPGDVSTVK